jgi:D-lactate dehydrogenase (cytochrome)
MLRLFPHPSSYVTAFVALASVAAALPLLNRLQQATGGQVVAFELIDRKAFDLVLKEIPGTSNPLSREFQWALLIEVANSSALDATEATESFLNDSIERGFAGDAIFAKSLREREILWRLREAIPEAQRKQGPSISNDISVPLASLSEFVTSADAAVHRIVPHAVCITFGHVGDGNLHFAVLAPGHGDRLSELRVSIETAINECVWRLHGSISAEHGIGVARIDGFRRQKSAQEIQTMALIKRALDPNNILNPGKLFPGPV